MHFQQLSENLTSVVGLSCALRLLHQLSISRTLMSSCFDNFTSWNYLSGNREIIMIICNLTASLLSFRCFLYAASNGSFCWGGLSFVALMPNNFPIGWITKLIKKCFFVKIQDWNQKVGWSTFLRCTGMKWLTRIKESARLDDYSQHNLFHYVQVLFLPTYNLEAAKTFEINFLKTFLKLF